MVTIVRPPAMRRLLDPDATCRVTWLDGTFADAAMALRYLRKQLSVKRWKYLKP